MDRADLITGIAQPGDRPPAPEPLRLIQDFVNTVDRENVVELFDAPAGLSDWLSHRGLPGAHRIGRERLRRAVETREALRTVLHANNGGAHDPHALATLEAVAARARLQPQFSADPPVLAPEATGLDAVLGELVAVVFTAMVDGSWARMKACPREVCGWAFYDRSTNNRATWCSMLVCGNRVKAGTYYRRRTA
jgi:predicted RNA-binding Zn ribbon-like protein